MVLGKMLTGPRDNSFFKAKMPCGPHTKLQCGLKQLFFCHNATERHVRLAMRVYAHHGSEGNTDIWSTPYTGRTTRMAVALNKTEKMKCWLLNKDNMQGIPK